uniref:Diguanylate cyclase n=1 Tax=mine drainage metagenome TaxID=410659 RepID=E6QQ80_9ZZZZ
MMAAVFAVLTPLWIVVDFLIFPAWVATVLASGRIVTSIAFALLALFCHQFPNARHFRSAISLLFIIPTFFFIFSRVFLGGIHFNAIGSAMATGYIFLPFILMTGLAFFPLMVTETLLVAFPLLSVFLASELIQWSAGKLIVADLLPNFSDMVIFWLLLLIALVSSLASFSQFQLMIRLFQLSNLDPLTQTMNRHSGEHILALQMAQAKRQSFPLSIAFLDLDDFKKLNDQFGHAAGDAVLLQAAEKFRQALREGDAVIRWGGEEFVIVMPYATMEQAGKRLDPQSIDWLLQRPDGQSQTWSGGIAQWPADIADTWTQLVKIADDRMYQAKKAGKGRMVLTDIGVPMSG